MLNADELAVRKALSVPKGGSGLDTRERSEAFGELILICVPSKESGFGWFE